MQRPLLPATDELQFLTFEGGDMRAKEVFWHSSSHLLGAALERIYGDDVLLCDGPALPEGGFFYEFLLLDPSKHSAASRLRRDVPYTKRIGELCGTRASLSGLQFLSAADMDHVHKVTMEIASEKHVFERMDVDYGVACDLFLDNPFKLHFLDRARSQAERQGASSDVFGLYKCGNMVDLCRGPHIVHTAQVQAVAINRVSSAHWVGHLSDGEGIAGGASSRQTAPVLSRVYGVSFPTQAMLRGHQQQLEEAARRDHRVIGKDQKLFMMHPWAPGSGFILPHGQRMVNTVMTTIRRKYAKYGFDEVSTPLMYNRRLWETSGHWENYREDMFAISSNSSAKGTPSSSCCGHSHDVRDSSGEELDEPEFGLKPMNCPGHCLIFASEQRSYKDLPIRYADFSPLHRNEIAGALSGLTRVRKFHQDDGHVFCAREQVADEIAACLRLIGEMYEMFGFTSYELALSTRPQSFMGEVGEWDEAECALKEALEKSGRTWALNEGDGAFYGPKIDVRVQDALGRKHQTATIQLDFQLPQRFQLKYTGADGKTHRPVMIHRAVLGSMERMLAILIEHWGGKWPFWINPRQAIVIPTSAAAADIVEYAQTVRSVLAGDKDPESVDSHRFFVDIDVSGNTMNRAVREAQMAQYGFILVVGEKELRSGTVDVRRREGGQRIGAMPIADVRAMFQGLVETYK
ncbi:hypothetical protein GGH95_000894 [Coemansia sp. RSA 1836]|nr:hypothetical protein GGH95_000894 [Coemansia sp. RSA 1836]